MKRIVLRQPKCRPDRHVSGKSLFQIPAENLKRYRILFFICFCNFPYSVADTVAAAVQIISAAVCFQCIFHTAYGELCSGNTVCISSHSRSEIIFVLFQIIRRVIVTKHNILHLSVFVSVCKRYDRRPQRRNLYMRIVLIGNGNCFDAVPKPVLPKTFSFYHMPLLFPLQDPPVILQFFRSTVYIFCRFRTDTDHLDILWLCCVFSERSRKNHLCWYRSLLPPAPVPLSARS